MVISGCRHYLPMSVATFADRPAEWGIMRTKVCEMFGIEFPILAFTHCRDVAAAVTKAGGMGVLGASGITPEELDVDLRWIREEVGDRPFGVDVIVPAKYEGADEGGLSWSRLEAMIPPAHREFLDDMMRRYEVPPLPADEGPRGRSDRAAPMSLNQAHGLLEVAFAHPISLIANALGPPPKEMLDQAGRLGVKVGALAGKKAHAVRHVAAGVDLVIAQGYEAGGHTGEIATMVLVPEIVDAVAPIPVLAAGGIGRGRQLAAALTLGAEGVWCGSIWLTTEEAETHPTVKQKFLDASSSDTLRSRSRTGKPARQLRSAWTDEWEGPNSPGPLGMPLQPALIAEASRRVDRAANDPNSKAAQLANYFVGQIVGEMNQVKPTRRVMLEMIDEFIDAMQRVDAMME
jgi:NAD(P)H-dependent flavin oxidoreductase YrpB (nitropropane dioxygenase family)